MSTLLLTDRDHPEVVIVCPKRARTWLWARVHAYDLDRMLAAGASPDQSAALALRAELLLRTSTRIDTLRALRRLVEPSALSASPAVYCVPLCRRKIRRSSGTLLELARRLQSGAPVDVRGVAPVRALLSSGDGPFYAHPAADDLDPALAFAVAALDIAS